jgi:hypothetical protein
VTDDPFWNYDGAYVLGALTPSERHRYEQHLRTCARCADGVRQLSGLPDLLAQAHLAVNDDPANGEPPATLLPALLTAARRDRRRVRRRATLSMLAAAACAIALITLGTSIGLRPHHPAPPLAGVAMSHVAAAPINADAALIDLAWGTRIDLHCTYSTPWTNAAPGSYVLVVIDTAGHARPAAAWRVVPARISTISASTDLRRADIARIEVRTPRGQPVLQLTPPW